MFYQSYKTLDTSSTSFQVLVSPGQGLNPLPPTYENVKYSLDMQYICYS